jgi:hypothetical protein
MGEEGRRDRFILMAPLVYLLHFLEESPRFVPWFDAHVARGITQWVFWRVNLGCLVITSTVVAAEWWSRSAVSLAVAAAWLGFLMFANAVFHVAGAAVDGGYVPGVVTAVALYLPYVVTFFVRSARSRRLPVGGLLVAIALGASPMVLHGYLILFRGSRLF